MKKLLIVIAAVLTFSATAAAQIGSMTGTVLSADDGQPLIGVTVTVTGTDRRTITDMDGHFEITGLKPSDKTVTFTYIGMAAQTVKIAAEVTVYMESDTELMDELVVVAFGKQTKEAFTGSATVVKSDDLTKQPANDPIKALSGKVPGMTVISSNNPTSESTINIRGLGSVNASTTPLIVVDGQPFNGKWRDINPADVDNISVLKDAASNALYGARGANGVIMITTKSAQKGQTRISLDMKYGISTDAQVEYDKIDNPGEYYEAHYLALKNYYTRSLGYSEAKAHLEANNTMIGTSSSSGGLGYIVYSVPDGEALIGSNGRLNPNATLGNVIYNNGEYYTLYPDDWKAAGIRNGFRQEYNLNMSGGGEGYSVYASIGSLDQQGITYGSDLKRLTARLKADYTAYKWLTFGANANFSNSRYNNLYSAFSDAYTIAPIYPLYLRDAYGNILQDERGDRYDYGDATIGFYRQALKNTNDIQSDRLDTNTRDANSFGINGYVNIDLPYNFRLTINGGTYVQESRTNVAYNPYYGYYSTTQGYVSASQSRQITDNTQQLLTWNHDAGRHHVDILVGHEYNRTNSASTSGTKSNVAMFEENIELDGSVINNDISGSSSKYNVEGYLGRLQYDFDSRIFASASFRRDASSRFHPDHRWGNFWSVGGAWIISKEQWFPQSENIDMLKFKASYGEQGNDGLGSSFYWTDYYYIKNANDQVAYTFGWKGNPDITWETTGAFNSGFEFNLFKGRLNGTAEYYSRKTRDMLFFYSVPSALGYSGYYDNIGDMINRGVEVSLDATLIQRKSFSWGANLNFSYEKNHISRLPDTSKRLTLDGHWGYPGNYYFYGEGLPMYTWYMPQYAGPNEEGLPTWKVRKSDGTETVTTNYDSASKYNCGTALPVLYGGFGSSISIGSFDIGATFTFSVGGKKLDNGYLTLMGSPYGSSYGSNIHRDALKGWSEDNTDAQIPRWQYNDMQTNMTSDFFLVDASQISFQDVQVGYSMPSRITRKFGCSSLRVNFSVDGVGYWTRRKGFDPRSVRAQYSGEGYGAMRTYLIGLNLQF